MSLSAIAGFAQGFGASRERKNEQKRHDDWMTYHNNRADQMGSMGAPPQGAGPAYTKMQPGAGGFGYGKPGSGGAGVPGNGDFASLLAAKEGGGRYDTLFGHSQNGGRFAGVDVSKMTLDELAEFSKPSGEYGQWVKGKVGRVATPMGFGQIVGTTMRNTAQQMGLPSDTVFNQETQTNMVNHLAGQRISGGKTPAAKRAGLRAEWEGFHSVSDADLDQAIAKFEANGGSVKPRALGAPQPTMRQGDYPQ
jgi:hypothetical protein